MQENEYYIMRDGRVIEDPDMARIMRFLVDTAPMKQVVYSWDDIGTATLVSDIYEESLRYCPQNDSWYIWEGCWRKQIDNGRVSDMLQTVLNLMLLYCNEIDVPDTGDDDGKMADDVKKYRKYVSSVRSYTKMRNIMEVMKTMLRLSIQDMDKNPYMLNTPSTTYDLRTGKVIDDYRQFNPTKMTSCDLPGENDKRCERWYSFVDEITGGDTEKAGFLKRALGYSLLGVNREECMFIAYGAKTRNGKGTLFSAVTGALGEDYADSAPPDLICESKNGRTTDYNAPQPALAKLVGTRLVRMSESSRDVRLDAASMKTMTGRDTLVTRGLFQNAFSFVPQFTLWLETNHLPAVTDDTVFNSNRIHVITFDQQFTGSAQDKNLKEIFADPANQPTILEWLVEGCTEYIQSDGLNPPVGIIEATAQYRKLHDRIGNFIEECCTVGEASDLRGDIYARYSQWCTMSENRYRPIGSTSFYAELAARGFPAKRKTDGYYILGLKLKDLSQPSNGTIKLT